MIKQFLPYGLVQLVQSYRELTRLGLSRAQAWRAAFSPKQLSALHSTRLNLLPQASLNEIEYVVDVGANEGLWSLGVLSVCQPKQLVVVEPTPNLQPVLKSRLGHFPNVRILSVAAGSKPGTAKFHMATHSHGSSLLKPKAEMNNFYGHGYNIAQEILVPVETLDHILADLPAISVLKIDVQGYESFVLEGSHETLKKTKYLILEVNFHSHYEGDTLFSELHNKMIDLGFYLHNLSPPFRLKQRCLWADAIYARSEG